MFGIGTDRFTFDRSSILGVKLPSTITPLKIPNLKLRVVCSLARVLNSDSIFPRNYTARIRKYSKSIVPSDYFTATNLSENHFPSLLMIVRIIK